MTITKPGLYPQQVCFVVDDVPDAVTYCREQFGWGPFYQFKAPVAEASYRNWEGEKLTEVALGMAGKVQVELIRVHKGHDAVEAYQASYGAGLQHVGVACNSREEATEHLLSLGGKLNEQNEYPGIRFAFIDTPTGPAMFELLQRTDEFAANTGLASSRKTDDQANTLFNVDRVTIVTRDMDEALPFFSAAFGWDNACAADATLGYGSEQARLRRHIGTAGALELELLQPEANCTDPYATHLLRGEHGLVHAGGVINSDFPAGAALQCEWLETGDTFALYDWAGGPRSLQIRRAGPAARSES